MLEHWMPSCRNRFTVADFDFVTTALGGTGGAGHLEKLWRDPEGRRELLDLKEVMRHLIETPVALPVSPRFYFYVLVRHSFLDADLADPELADYVAGVMARRVASESGDPLHNVTGGFTHAAQFLSFILRSRGRMRFHLQVAAGNQFLILTGLYPDFLRGRSARGEAPELGFYESFAGKAFGYAADCCLARGGTGSGRRIFGTLAESFSVARLSLNRLAEEFVFLGD